MRFPVSIFFILTFICTGVTSQNKQFLFGFHEIPQALLENPGSEVNFIKHYGIPFLSGVYVKGGTNNGLISGLFANEGANLNDNLRSLIFRLNSRDFISVNEQLDIINIGYKLKNDKDYLSFGFYQEFDLLSYYPRDLAILFYQGNTDGNGNINLDVNHDISDVNFKSEMIGVFHAGISRKINKKLNIGARAKLYSGAFSIQSLHNQGNISTRLDQSNNLQHILIDVNATFRSSGLSGINGKTVIGNAFKNMLFGGNLGLGFDVGFTYHLEENLTISGSILDIGFMTYSNDVKTYKVNGDIEINGIGLLDPSVDDTLDYWDNLSEDFNRQIPKDTLHRTYVSFRSPKINGSIKYGFGEPKKKRGSIVCADLNNNQSISYQNEVGIQLYSIFRPIKPQFATTLYYSRSVSDFLKAKITYTADSYSLSNIGLGFSTHLGKFNFYASADNLLGYKNIYSSEKISILLGMNLIFDK